MLFSGAVDATLWGPGRHEAQTVLKNGLEHAGTPTHRAAYVTVALFSSTKYIITVHSWHRWCPRAFPLGSFSSLVLPSLVGHCPKGLPLQIRQTLFPRYILFTVSLSFLFFFPFFSSFCLLFLSSLFFPTCFGTALRQEGDDAKTRHLLLGIKNTMKKTNLLTLYQWLQHWTPYYVLFSFSLLRLNTDILSHLLLSFLTFDVSVDWRGPAVSPERASLNWVR